MRPKIELGKEYPTRGGGKAVVHFIDGNHLLGRVKSPGEDRWEAIDWFCNGALLVSGSPSRYDILLPRTVMVPVTVPEWAESVRILEYGQLAFSGDPADSVWMSIEDWIASLEENDAS